MKKNKLCITIVVRVVLAHSVSVRDNDLSLRLLKFKWLFEYLITDACTNKHARGILCIHIGPCLYLFKIYSLLKKKKNERWEKRERDLIVRFRK